MSSSIEEEFYPPVCATKDEVIKIARHYINYWKIEANHRNHQWIIAMDENDRLKKEITRLRFEIDVHVKGLNSDEAYQYYCKLEMERKKIEGNKSL